MYKLLLVVLAVLAVAAAQFIASPYYGGYRSGYYGGLGYASPYAYRSALGYGGYGFYG